MEDRLYRSRDDRMVAGVAGGLAERWDSDPSLVRLFWALLMVFTGGIFFLIYVIMAIVVPEEPLVSAAPATPGVAGTPDEAPGAPMIAQIDATPTPYGLVPTRAEARATRRAARRANRANRDGQTAAAIGGLFLILLGSFFLIRQWIPQLDFDWFWPAILIGIGVAIILGTLTRRSEPSGPAPTDSSSEPRPM